MNDNYNVWFIPGAETRDNKFNIFTGSFIRLMKQILGDSFRCLQGVNYKSSMINVIWALNNAQKPIDNPANQKITKKAFSQITSNGLSKDTQLIITSSSSGSIIAAQTACYLAEANKNKYYFNKPFHLALGASMISTESDLFRQLIIYQKDGLIGTIIHNELLDEGDSSSGIGGLTKAEAYRNAFGLMFPWISKKFSGPSFLNTHPVNGHIHRKRSKTVEKAVDFIDVLLIKNKLAGDNFKEKAITVSREASLKMN
jgi:hypothetical protein